MSKRKKETRSGDKKLGDETKGEVWGYLGEAPAIQYCTSLQVVKV